MDSSSDRRAPRLELFSASMRIAANTLTVDPEDCRTLPAWSMKKQHRKHEFIQDTNMKWCTLM
jgi:hypothetical protein